MHVIRPSDRAYPARLGESPDAPSLLYVLGTVGDRQRSIAIVGSRSASRVGVDRAAAIARELAAGGVTIVSGGALGIDAAAHRGALDAGGHTVAVLGTGLDVVYPSRNRALFDDIYHGGGALVTIYKEGTPPLPYHFVRRNLIIAGLADLVLVAEASARSGALHTARAARRYGRLVAAVPGSPGTEWLISSGAAVVEDAGDVVAALEGRPRRPDISLPERGSEQGLVLLALETRIGRDPQELSSTTGIHPRKVNQHLLGLELSGLAVSLPGRASYVRSPLAQDLLGRLDKGGGAPVCRLGAQD